MKDETVFILKEKYKNIQDLFQDEKEFNDFLQKMNMAQEVIQQVDFIFRTRILNENAIALRESAEKMRDKMIKTMHSKYIEIALENKQLPPIPQIEDIVSWISESYKGILSQLFNEEYLQIVINPSLEDIAAAIIEFTYEEEPGNKTEAV